MPEEVLATPQPQPKADRPLDETLESKQTNWPKMVLAIVLGLALLAGAAYAGYWYGTESAKLPPEADRPLVDKSQISKPQPKTQIQPTPTPEPTPAVEDETKDWKTYTNENLRYTIEYPREFKVDELTGVILFYRGKIETPPGSPIDPYIGDFAIYDRSGSEKSAREACDAELCTNLSDPAVGSQWSLEEVKINNSVGVRVTSTPRPFWADYYLASTDGTRIVRVMLGAWSSEPTQEHLRNDLRLLESTLSTFKFLD